MFKNLKQIFIMPIVLIIYLIVVIFDIINRGLESIADYLIDIAIK